MKFKNILIAAGISLTLGAGAFSLLSNNALAGEQDSPNLLTLSEAFGVEPSSIRRATNGNRNGIYTLTVEEISTLPLNFELVSHSPTLDGTLISLVYTPLRFEINWNNNRADERQRFTILLRRGDITEAQFNHISRQLQFGPEAEIIPPSVQLRQNTVDEEDLYEDLEENIVTTPAPIQTPEDEGEYEEDGEMPLTANGLIDLAGMSDEQFFAFLVMAELMFIGYIGGSISSDEFNDWFYSLDLYTMSDERFEMFFAMIG